MSNVILGPMGNELRAALPKAKSVHPFGSKILVEILRADEIMGSSLHISENTQMDGAPQAYITEMGPNVPSECGLKVGQRVYWTGKGTQIENPGCTSGRVNALLEVSNILAVIEECQN
jgi:co-chaperonin GroES (HSP10)